MLVTTNLEIYNCVCVCVCVCAHIYHMCSSIYRGQKRSSGSPRLELQVAVSHPLQMLGTELASSAKTMAFLTAELSRATYCF